MSHIADHPIFSLTTGVGMDMYGVSPIKSRLGRPSSSTCSWSPQSAEAAVSELHTFARGCLETRPWRSEDLPGLGSERPIGLKYGVQ